MQSTADNAAYGQFLPEYHGLQLRCGVAVEVVQGHAAVLAVYQEGRDHTPDGLLAGLPRALNIRCVQLVVPGVVKFIA